MVDYKGRVRSKDRTIEDRTICSVINRSLVDIGSDSDNLASSLNTIDDLTIGSMHSDNRKGRVSAADLARRLNIPVEMAKRTLKATSQLAVRTVGEASLTRKFRTNDRMLRYRRLSFDVFTDTFFSSKATGGQSEDTLVARSSLPNLGML